MEALTKSGIEHDKELVFHAEDALRKGGYQAVDAMLAKGIDFTAIFATTDLNADQKEAENRPLLPWGGESG